MSSRKLYGKVVLREIDPCPCGSGQPMSHCHFDPVLRRFIPDHPKIETPSNTTGFAHDRCYLRFTNDCSTQISREHYVSKSVLDQLGTTINVTGMPWMKAEDRLSTTSDSMVAKILCRRHNSILSPIDTAAAGFFRGLTDVMTHKKGSLSKKTQLRLTSGPALERWLMKVTCGVFHSVGSDGKQLVQENYTLDNEKVRRALFHGHLGRQCGLYFAGGVGTMVDVKSEIAIGPLLNPDRMTMCGVSAQFRGLRFDFVFDAAGLADRSLQNCVHRPSELVCVAGLRRQILMLSWPSGTPAHSIRIQRI